MAEASSRNDAYRDLLERNRRWAEEAGRRDPDLFPRLARGQTPEFLIVACCDSREALDVATDSDPGHLFIHRNVANLVRDDDPALAATLEFGLEALPIRHLVVSGHTRCGGVQAALDRREGGAVGGWIAPLRTLAERHRSELDALPPDRRAERLVELNVVEQVRNLLRRPLVRTRVDRGELQVHGWIFEVESGRLRQVELPAS